MRCAAQAAVHLVDHVIAHVPVRQWVLSLANLNIHLHCLVLDGVYRCGADRVLIFFQAGAPNDDELHALLQTVINRRRQAAAGATLRSMAARRRKTRGQH